jgi:DNA polymerase III delta prime subunit
MDDVKARLRQAVEWPMQHAEAFKRLNVKPPRGVLLHGPPGCCKTTLVRERERERERERKTTLVRERERERESARPPWCERERCCKTTLVRERELRLGGDTVNASASRLRAGTACTCTAEGPVVCELSFGGNINASA